MNTDNFRELFKDVLPSNLGFETACQLLQRDAAMVGQSCSTHSIEGDSTCTCVGHVGATRPDQRSAWPLSHRRDSADGCPSTLLPRRHLFTASLSPSDRLYPADRRASSEATLVILLFRNPDSPIQRHLIQAPRRDGNCSWSARLSLPSPLSLKWQNLSDMGWHICSTPRLWSWQAASPLRFLWKTQEKLKLFHSKVEQKLTPTFDRKIKDIGPFRLCAGRKENWIKKLR